MTEKDLDLDSILDDALDDLVAEEKIREEKMKNLLQDCKINEKSDEKKILNNICGCLDLDENDVNINDTSRDFSSDLAKNLRSLAKNTTFQDAESGAAPPNIEEFGNTLKIMMEQLVSKDVLYEPLLEMRSKYPSWLEENSEQLSPGEFKRYSKQLEVIKDICNVYENDEQKNQDSFQKIFQLFSMMQEMGQPPMEIVKDLSPGIPFDNDGVPDFHRNNSSNSDCNPM